jgi:hypothetical protein
MVIKSLKIGQSISVKAARNDIVSFYKNILSLAQKKGFKVVLDDFKKRLDDPDQSVYEIQFKQGKPTPFVSPGAPSGDADARLRVQIRNQKQGTGYWDVEAKPLGVKVATFTRRETTLHDVALGRMLNDAFDAVNTGEWK